jgi:iron complex outermembrane receptor protein
MSRFRRLTLATPIVLGLAGAAAAQPAADPAPAQQPSAQATELTEVVVSARKREETVQSVPATVQVASQEMLQKAGVTNFRDLNTVAPGLNISNAPSPNQFAVTIRGLGSKPGNPSFDQSVSLFVDGVYSARAREFSGSMFDISRVEIVRGTQAALLGKNTSLGALNLVPNKPGRELGGYARYQHEFELDSNRAEAAIDLPVSDKLRFRVAGLYDQQGGAITNIIDGTKGRETLTRAARIVGIWNATDHIDVTATWQADNNRSRGASAEFIAASPVPALLASRAGYPGTVETNFDYRTAIYAPAMGGVGGQHDFGQRGSATLNWDLGANTLTLQSGYTTSKSSSKTTVAYLPGNYALQNVDDKSRQFTQEIRLASSTGGRFEYLIGGLYLDGRYQNYTYGNANYPSLAPGAPAVAGANITGFGQSDEAYSAFGQGNYRLTPELQLTAGLRYTHETKSVDLSRRTITPGVYSLVVLPPYAPFSLDNTDSSIDASVGANYQVKPNILFYVSWGQGTKAGGFAQAASKLELSGYDPEIARTVEGGVKAQFDERRLTFNAALFRTKVKDFQLVNFSGVNFEVSNTDLRSTGLETEWRWTPAPGLALFWNNTYAETRDTRVNAESSFAPKWDGAVGASYQWNLTHDLRASIDANLDYRSHQLSQDAGVAVPPLEASKLLNMSIGLRSFSTGVDVRLVGKNLTDQKRLGFVFPGPFIGPGNVVGVPLDPRTIALQIGYRY